MVFAAYHKAVEGFDPQRGSFEAYMQAVVRTSCAYWWRRQGRSERARDHLMLVSSPADRSREERAARNQEAMLEALSPDERAVFSAWALQKHLGKGRVSAEEVGRGLGMGPREFDNAKRRLKAQLRKLLDRFGWSTADLLRGEDDVEQTG